MRKLLKEKLYTITETVARKQTFKVFIVCPEVLTVTVSIWSASFLPCRKFTIFWQVSK